MCREAVDPIQGPEPRLHHAEHLKDHLVMGVAVVAEGALEHLCVILHLATRIVELSQLTATSNFHDDNDYGCSCCWHCCCISA